MIEIAFHWSPILSVPVEATAFGRSDFMVRKVFLAIESRRHLAA
jgi:hypothetical protein